LADAPLSVLALLAVFFLHGCDSGALAAELACVGVRRKTIQARERVLAGAAPFFFFVLLVGWVSLALLGYALILWSPAFVDGIGRGGDSFVDALYVAGSALFTLGVGGDVTGSTRAVVVAAGATGLGLFAVAIAYLPVLYQAFNRREVGVLLLDARAGSPPSGPELLHRMGIAGVASSLPELFQDWERWVADVLETHMSYPLLTVFRSPHDNTSWITSLGSVLDAATLIITSVDDEPDERAKLLYGTGVHAVEDLFYYLSAHGAGGGDPARRVRGCPGRHEGGRLRGTSGRPGLRTIHGEAGEVRAAVGRDRRVAGRAAGSVDRRPFLPGGAHLALRCFAVPRVETLLGPELLHPLPQAREVLRVVLGAGLVDPPVGLG